MKNLDEKLVKEIITKKELKKGGYTYKIGYEEDERIDILKFKKSENFIEVYNKEGEFVKYEDID